VSSPKEPTTTEEATSLLSRLTERGARIGDDSLIYGLKPPEKGGFWLRHPGLIRILAVTAVLGGWEVYGRSLNPIFLSTPSRVVPAFWELIQDGRLLTATRQSLEVLFIGMLISIVGGVLLGALMGLNRIVFYVFDPFVTALYNTPSVVLIPLIMLWFGLGVNAKVVIVILSAIFPIVIGTYAGVTNTSRGMVDVVRAFGGTDRQVSTKVTLPSAVPFIAAGMRLAVGRGVIGVVVAEFFTALSGLGGLAIIFSNTFATAKLWVPVLTLIALGLILTSTARWAEDKIAPWKETERARLGG
jgi:ABC-type nitrate/sulfonate/bicarbonate transport system permease component